MFNFLQLNNTMIGAIFIFIWKAVKHLYCLYCTEVFHSGFNCSFQRKMFFTFTGFNKMVYHTITYAIHFIKCLVWVECNISGFNCSYQRRVFKTSVASTKLYFYNLPLSIYLQYKHYSYPLFAAGNIMNFFLINISKFWLCVFTIINSLLAGAIKSIFIIPFVVVLLVNFAFIFLGSKIKFLYNRFETTVTNMLIKSNYIFVIMAFLQKSTRAAN